MGPREAAAVHASVVERLEHVYRCLHATRETPVDEVEMRGVGHWQASREPSPEQGNREIHGKVGRILSIRVVRMIDWLVDQSM